MVSLKAKQILSEATIHSEQSEVVSYNDISTNQQTSCILNFVPDTTNRPVGIASNGYTNGIISGKIVNSNNDKFLGMLLNYQGVKNKIVNSGIIADEGLIGGALNQKVYIDVNTGFLSLTKNTTSVGKIVSLSPKKIIIINDQESYVNLYEDLNLLDNNGVEKVEPSMFKINMYGADRYASSVPIGLTLGIFITAMAHNGKDKYVCSLIDTFGQTALFTSTNGTTWTLLLGYPSNRVRDIIFYKNKFILCGNNILKISTDGITWTNPNVNPFLLANLYNRITYSESRITIIGAGSSGVVHTLFSDDEGNNWDGFGTNFAPHDHLVDIAYGNNVYIAVTNYISTGTFIQRSTDECATWNAMPQVTQNLFSVCFGKNIFVTVGSGGSIYSSYDNGLTWNTNFVGVDNFVKVIYISQIGLFVATNDKGRIAISSDGSQWTLKSFVTHANVQQFTLFGSFTKIYCATLITNEKGRLLATSSNNFGNHIYTIKKDF